MKDLLNLLKAQGSVDDFGDAGDVGVTDFVAFGGVGSDTARILL